MDINGISKQRVLSIVLCFNKNESNADFVQHLMDSLHNIVDNLVNSLSSDDSMVSDIRLKVVVFGDYKYDKKPIIESPFYFYYDQTELIKDFVRSIDVFEDGESKKNGFEALYYAMMSDWTIGKFDRQLILFFTDRDALPLQERKGEKNYPSDMPDMAGLENTWACVNKNCSLNDRTKRLVIYAPKDSIYGTLLWNRMMFYPLEEGELNTLNVADLLKPKK